MSFPIPDSILKNAQVLASDIDDTLTIGGRIPGENIDLISKLRAVGLMVFLVTGRTAGHAFSATTWFPVDGAIAENGGIICEGENRRLGGGFQPAMMETIAKAFDEIGKVFPEARPTQDNFMRLTDKTFYVDEFSPEKIERARAIAAGYGLSIVYSSVHLHVCDPKINKGATLKPLLEQKGVTDMNRVLTIGDSPNDEGFFDTDLFPNSVGVANVRDYMDRLNKTPNFILEQREGHGFAALAKALLQAKGA